MAWRILRLDFGPSFAKVSMEPDDSERQILNELFVVMSDKRAILDYYGRADQGIVTGSIRSTTVWSSSDRTRRPGSG
jgi:hypothetical protein